MEKIVATPDDRLKEISNTLNRVLLDRGIFPGPAWTGCLIFAIDYHKKNGRWPTEKNLEISCNKQLISVKEKLTTKGVSFSEIWETIIKKIDE